jgi:hypothetical protein
MADGSLDEAHDIAEKLAANKASAKTILESLLKQKKPVPQLQNIPQKVLEGFIKNMLTKMK